MNSVKYELNILPPTSNHAIKSSFRGYYPTKEYKEFKRAVDSLKEQIIEKSSWYTVKRIFYLPLYYKNGNVRKLDVTNRIKYLDDFLCKKSGIDDSQIIWGSEVKVNSDIIKVEWELCTFEQQDYLSSKNK